MRLVAYTRVSTDRQSEEGLGLSVQIRAIRGWAQGNGHKITAVMTDEGVSGSNGLETRFGLADALRTIKAGRGNGLVVYRLDRLARDVILQEQILRELWGTGAEVFSVSPSESQYLRRDDPEDPSRRLIRTVLGAVAEYERSMISLRLRSGRRRKAEMGGFAYGAPPYGFGVAEGKLIKLDSEQEVVTLIKTLRRDSRSLPQICEELSSRGILPRRGSRWHPTVVSRIASRA